MLLQFHHNYPLVEESFPMKRELKGAKPNRDTAQPGEMKVFIRGRKEEGSA